MRVLLVPNTGNVGAVAATAELVAWLLGRGLEPVLSISDAQSAGLPDFGVVPSQFEDIVLAVALGGDGTILKAVHLLDGAETPLLGVKFGRLGFLSGASPEHMRDAIETALAGEARVERRATLRADVIMDGRPVGSYLALNEVVVARGPSGRVVALDLAIDGHRIMHTRADGIIVATATGSTAYALSAGGPAVSPSFGGMVVVPVAPHTLCTRAIVTDPSDVIEITLPDPSRADACLLVDGDITPCRQLLERITVTRGGTDVLLVKLEGRHFYETLESEFFGG
jgi:NAD+ kinase